MSRHASLSTALFAALRVPGRLREAALDELADLLARSDGRVEAMAEELGCSTNNVRRLLDEWRAVATGREVGGTAA